MSSVFPTRRRPYTIIIAASGLASISFRRSSSASRPMKTGGALVSLKVSLICSGDSSPLISIRQIEIVEPYLADCEIINSAKSALWNVLFGGFDFR